MKMTYSVFPVTKLSRLNFVTFCFPDVTKLPRGNFFRPRIDPSAKPSINGWSLRRQTSRFCSREFIRPAVLVAALLLSGLPTAFAQQPPKPQTAKPTTRSAAKPSTPKPGTNHQPSTTSHQSPNPVTALAFFPDGKTLAVGVYREVQFWDLETKKKKSVWRGHKDAVRSLVFTKDGKMLAAGGGLPAISGEVRLWDTTTGRETKVLGEHTDNVNAVAFSLDGKMLASASADKTIRIWNIETGKTLQTLKEHTDVVWGVGFSADSKTVVSCSADRSVKAWDTANGKRLYSIGAHEEAVFGLEFTPNGNQFVTISGDRTAKVWNFGRDNSGQARTLGGHGQVVQAEAIAPNGEWVATASGDKSVKVWRIGDGGNTATLTDAKEWLYSVRFSPDNKRLAAGTWDGNVLLWNTADNKLEAKLEVQSVSTP
jgi:WD40 repeat protein